MEHSFDIEIAQQVGVQAAIIYKHIKFWCAKNKANDVHLHDGYYWTYNSKKAFSELFPYMTERQIDYALTKLLNAGLIIKGNYNTSAYDKTLWYADVCLLDNTKLCNRDTEIVEPIPDSKQHIVNINDILSKDNISNADSAKSFQFGKPKKESKTSSNVSEYNDALLLVLSYTTNKTLKKELTSLVNMKKDIASKERHKFYASTIKNYLDGLDETFGTDENQKIEAVRLSIRYNGTTKIMIPNSSYNGGNVKSMEGFTSPDIENDGLNHTKSEREF